MITRLLVEYDGTDFAGWAAQPGLRTVRGELEAALATVLRQPVELSVAGRTDAGVHAAGQVAAYVGPPPPLRKVNALTGADLVVLAADPAPEGFSPRGDAEARSYRYRVLARSTPSAFERGRRVHWPYRCDHERLHACAALLPGAHDFTAFTLTETEHRTFVRRVETAGWEIDGDRLDFVITANAFVRHMNRALVGTMLEVAQGRRTVAGFARLLAGAHRRDAGHTAAPHGLTLERVRYPEHLGLPGG